MRTVLTLAAMLVALPAAAQKVYRCPLPTGGHEYTNAPCDADSEPLQLREAAHFGGSSRSAEMRLEQTRCIVIVSHPKATGWVVNATNVDREASVRATFLARGEVRETTTRQYTVPAFGRTPFEIIGPMNAGVDTCDYYVTWD